MEETEIKKLIRLPMSLAERVAAYRHDARVKFENAAIVQLIETGLEAIDRKRAGAEDAR